MRTTRITEARTNVTTAPTSQRRTYTVTEVAALVGISRTTAYECVRRGEIPSRRFGRRIVVLRRDLDDLLSGSATDGDLTSPR